MVATLKKFKLSRSISNNPSIFDSDLDTQDILGHRNGIEEIIEFRIKENILPLVNRIRKSKKSNGKLKKLTRKKFLNVS